MHPLWQVAKVAEPISLSELQKVGSPFTLSADEAKHYGAFVLNADEATIFSLAPAEDFEINTNVIKDWRLVLMDGQEILGDLDYFAALTKLKPQAADEQNGSLLIEACPREMLEQLLDK